MIKAILPGDRGFEAAAAGRDPYGAIHTARWALYGGDSGPPRFWRTAEGTGLLSLAGDTLTGSGSFPDPEELASFFAICGAKQLRGPRPALEAAADLLGLPVQSRQILCAAGPLRPFPSPPGLCEPSPREVYPLLVKVFGLPQEEFGPWYCEVSHKLRHGQGCLLGVRATGQMAATAGIYHQNKQAALIGSVATDPAFRGRGYAVALVFSLADRAQKSGRIPFVICQNPAAVRVYERVGFRPWGEEWLCHR
ncbi:MAG: GNAT family N-acetyltransferase [Oscillospiraceae bacterium]|nr:GNAT family N-acetyltransferase [Oscillospiraceae bacterium]